MGFVSPGLVLASNKAIMEAQRGIAFAKYFSTDFSAELQSVGKTVAVPVFSGSATVYSEAAGSVNNYETTDGSIIPVNVSLSKIVKVTYKLGQNDLLEVNKSSTSRNCGIAGGRAIGRKLEEEIMGLLTYAGAKATVASFAYNKIGKALATAEKNDMDPATCVVILNPDVYGDLLDANTNNAAIQGDDIAAALGRKYGCKAILCSAKVGAAIAAATATGGCGFVVPDSAIAIASRGIEQAVDGMYSEYGTETDEASGLTVTAFVHGSHATNTRYMNVACLMGCRLTNETNATTSQSNGAPKFIQLKTTA